MVRRFATFLPLALALATSGCAKDKATASPDEGTEPEPQTDVADEAEPVDSGDDAEPAAATLDKGNFEVTVNDNMQDVADCYSEAVSANAELAGTLNAEFKFDGDGTVTEVIALDGSTLQDEGLVNCIAARAQNWGFAKPAADEGLALDYSFTLEPG